MKKMFVVLLAAVLSASALASCTSDPETSAVTESTQTADSNLNEPGAFPIVKEQVTLSVFAHPTPESKVDSYDAEDGNIFAEWYEEKTNVKFDFYMAPSANDIATSISTLMASNDLPDILLSNTFSPEQQLLYGSEDIIIEIGDLVETQAPRIKKFWDDMPEVKAAVTLPGNKIYAVNSATPNDHSISWNKMYVYKPWLDALGLSVPTTTEEFYNTLVAFRDNDPNENGKNDEIPLMGNNSWVAWNPIVYLINPFTYNDGGRNIFVDENKQIYAAYTTEEYKEAMKWINQLYLEGLIAPETFTVNDMATFKNVLNQEPCIIGFLPTHAPFTATDIYKDDYVMVPPLEGPNGECNTTQNMGTITTSGTIITSNCENPEVAIRVIDGLLEPEVFIRSYYGVEDMEWAYAEEGMLNKEGEQAMFQSLTSLPEYSADNRIPNSTWPQTINLRGNS